MSVVRPSVDAPAYPFPLARSRSPVPASQPQKSPTCSRTDDARPYSALNPTKFRAGAPTIEVPTLHPGLARSAPGLTRIRSPPPRHCPLAGGPAPIAKSGALVGASAPKPTSLTQNQPSSSPALDGVSAAQHAAYSTQHTAYRRACQMTHTPYNMHHTTCPIVCCRSSRAVAIESAAQRRWSKVRPPHPRRHSNERLTRITRILDLSDAVLSGGGSGDS